MPPSAWLGIDIAKDTFAACLLTDKRVAQGTFENSPAGLTKLDRWLKKRQVGEVHACLEATGRYGEAPAEHLHAAGHTVSVINPARLKAFGQATLTRTKTDQTDAALPPRVRGSTDWPTSAAASSRPPGPRPIRPGANCAPWPAGARACCTCVSRKPTDWAAARLQRWYRRRWQPC